MRLHTSRLPHATRQCLNDKEKEESLGSCGLADCKAVEPKELMIVVTFWVQVHRQDSITVSKTRNFYGVLTVLERMTPTGLQFAKLVHGRTAHGLEFRDPGRVSWPTLYYNERGGDLRPQPDPIRVPDSN